MKQTQQQAPADTCLRLPQVLEIIPVSPSTWWLGVKEGRYPQPVKLGRRITAWRASDIQRLINEAV